MVKNLPNKGRFAVLAILLALYSFVYSPFVRADELVISDNGTGSQSNVNINQSSETTATQSNTAAVDNNVSASSQTGGNTVSDNSSAAAEVKTGDISTDVAVQTAANVSTLTTESCCGNGGNTAVISGNGEGSSNSATSGNSVATTVNVVNNATITTNIKGTAVTGNNSASGNTNADVSISTGNIKVSANIVNSPVNVSAVKVEQPLFQPFFAKIAENGSGSTNSVSSLNLFNPVINVTNNAAIKNILLWDLTSGGNKSDENNGKVVISSGNIELSVFIKNLSNLSDVKIEGCCKPLPTPTPVPEVSPTPNPGGQSSGVGGSSGSSFSGSTVPAGSEAGMGGPGVLGLSDTSSGGLQPLFFMLGILLSTAGLKLSAEGLASDYLKKR